MPERIVSHSKYGCGVVKQSRYKDFELLVQFQDGLTRWIRFDELAEAVPSSQIAPLTTATTFSPTPPINKAFKSRRMIEAFRLGIVPYDCVDDFTFGRQEESKELMNWLNSNNENILLLVGEYGTGKTHLLRYAYWRALQEGFAVAYVTMDPHEVPFHKPKSVYSHLIQNFLYYSKETKQKKQFRDFLMEINIESIFKDHTYFKNLSNSTSNEMLWDWIEGKEAIARPYNPNNNDLLNLPALYNYSTTANIYCYLLSTLGWAAKTVLGFKGLLLIFDEAEVLDLFTASQLKRGHNFLNALFFTAQNDEILLGNPRRGCLERNLDYCLSGIGRTTPFLYQRPCGLKLLFAFTPTNALNQLYKRHSPIRIDLQSLPNDALKRVFEHIYLLYENAYGVLKNTFTIETIFQSIIKQDIRTRLLVKSAVEILDLIRMNQVILLDGVLK